MTFNDHLAQHIAALCKASDMPFNGHVLCLLQFHTSLLAQLAQPGELQAFRRREDCSPSTASSALEPKFDVIWNDCWIPLTLNLCSD